jgi:hypothetical protein
MKNYCETINDAVKNGHLDCLEFGHKNKFLWDNFMKIIVLGMEKHVQKLHEMDI